MSNGMYRDRKRRAERNDCPAVIVCSEAKTLTRHTTCTKELAAIAKVLDSHFEKLLKDPKLRAIELTREFYNTVEVC